MLGGKFAKVNSTRPLDANMKLLVWVTLGQKNNKLNLNGPVNLYQKLLGQRNIYPNLDGPGRKLSAHRRKLASESNGSIGYARSN